MPASVDIRRVVAVAALLLALLGLWAGLRAGDARMPAAETAATGSPQRFPCLSYAPFRDPRNSPNEAGLIIPADAIERDLAQIAAVTSCIRLYGTANGLDAVPAIARTLGLRVWLGAWIGSDAQLNRLELERALTLANTHRDIVDRLIVGSETLLRGELPPQTLATWLAEARARSPVPVAYADVWEFWLRHAGIVGPQVDEAVIHILPYWEDQPVAVDAAVDHVVGVFTRMQRELSPLPVLIGETGWPAAGRMREGARAGEREQAQFLDALLARHALQPLPLNVIEAYDQPWKASLEGVAGAAWGVFRADGSARHPALQTTPNRRWPADAALIATGALLMLAVSLSLPGAVSGAISVPLRAALVGAVIGAAIALSWRELALLAIGSAGWSVRAAGIAASVIWALAEGRQLLVVLASRPCALSAGRRLQSLHSVALAATASYAAWLLVDGRYLDLAWPLLVAPALLLSLRRLLAGRETLQTPLHCRLRMAMCGLLAAAAPMLVVMEAWHNTSALMLALLMGVLAAGSWPGRRYLRLRTEAAQQQAGQVVQAAERGR